MGTISDAFSLLEDGQFEDGLRMLDRDNQWHDDVNDLEGPFFLGFPGRSGWGEGLLVASLLKRHAVANHKRIRVFAPPQVCSILKNDPSFETNEVEDFDQARLQGTRSPLVVLQAALLGNLLQTPFLQIETAAVPNKPACRIGIAWASLDKKLKPIPEKSIPLQDFFAIFDHSNSNFHVSSFQRHLSHNEREMLYTQFSDHLSEIPTDILDGEDDQTEVVKEIKRLDCMVTVSTTTAHIAACLGVPVILLAGKRSGPQWFWPVQAERNKHIYASVDVILCRQKNDWWEDCLDRARDSLSTTLQNR